MVIVISNPEAVAGEANIINSLFEEGLEILHLRKPGIAVNEIIELLKKIKPLYHHQIAIHQHHEMALEFGITRLHFTELKRSKISDLELVKLKKENYILSTSIHFAEQYSGLSPCFDYTFLGPVFNSLSKQQYTSSLPENFISPFLLNHPKIIAIGGIQASNMQKVAEMKFNGAAVLGAVWQTGQNSVEQYKIVKKAWNKAGQ